jgi:small subunit ribosomal protein S18
MEYKKRFVKKYCKYTAMKIKDIDYKDLDLIRISLSERGKIMPRRLTGTSKKYQEQVANAIKRARAMALIPYIVDGDNVSIPVYNINRAPREDISSTPSATTKSFSDKDSVVVEQKD